MKLNEAFDIFEESFVTVWGEYIKLHHEFDLYRGKDLSDEETEKVNMLISTIEDIYKELYPILYFVGKRFHNCGELIQSHERWIESLKKAGAQEVTQDIN